MKLTLNNGTVLDTVSVEESYYPRNTQGVILSVRMNSEESIEALRDAFTPEALENILVGEGDGAKAITGYTRVDSIRKFHSGMTEYNTAVDLIRETAEAGT